MSVLIEGSGDVPPRGEALRVCLDVNVFITDLLGAERGRNSSSTQLVEMVRRGWCSLGPVQLVVSWTMLETLRIVLTGKLGRDDAWVDLLVRNIADIAEGGALSSAPYVLLGGTGSRPMKDAEDGTVLDAALAGGADVLVIGDIDDFLSGGKSTLPTEVVAHRRMESGRVVPALAAIPRFGGRHLIVGVPQEAILWLSRGIEPTVENLRTHYAAAPITPHFAASTAATPERE